MGDAVVLQMVQGEIHPKDAGLPSVFYDSWHAVVDLDLETPGPEFPVPPVKPKRNPPAIFVGKCHSTFLTSKSVP